MSGRSVARSRGGYRGRGRGNNKSGRGGGKETGGSNSILRDDDTSDSTIRSLDQLDGFDCVNATDDMEISRVVAGSNVLESNPSNYVLKKWISVAPDLKNFLGVGGSANSVVTEIIKNLYREACPNWSSIPTLHKGHMFEEFQKVFDWDSQLDSSMKTIFYTVCARRLREMLRTARDNAYSKAKKEVGTGSGSHTTGSGGFLKSRQRLEKLKKLFGEKFGSDENEYPSFDQEIWEECTGGKKKGNYYGSGSSTDPCYVLTGTPSSMSSCSSYAPQQPQVQVLTLIVEQMREKHERDMEEMKLSEERHKKELEDMRAKNEELHAKNKAEKMEMKKTIDILLKYLPKQLIPP